VAPFLFPRALKLCRNRTEAEDIVQETLLRALRFEEGFERGTNLHAWVQQILFSVFLTRCRRKRRERRALEWLSTDPCAWTQRDALPPMRTLSRGVEGALRTLPENFARVVELVDLQEYSYRDAADVLGVPVGTVMSRLFRARRLLASALESTDLPRAA
jgi:RNA polymerase sigma-70 factor (ECF subfamily)